MERILLKRISSARKPGFVKCRCYYFAREKRENKLKEKIKII